jgi:hypothetical protein
MKTKSLKLIAAVALAALLGSTAPAAPQDAAKSGGSQNITRLRDEIRVLESVLNQNLTQAFPAPFAYLNAAHGAYLPGYGVIFTFEINLSRPSMGPFEGSPTAATERAKREEARRKFDQAKELSQRVLADFGHTLDQLGPDESVAVIVYGSAATAQGVEKSTAVLRVAKKDVDQYRANALDRAGFLSKVQTLEY